MSDEPDLTPDLTPEQDREVRRLLADARHTEPVPEDVAARLDRVLAELARGTGPEAATPVTVLASRRRQRVTSLLVAAAAVVVVGIGLGQVVGTGSGSDSDSAGTATTSRELQDAPAADQAAPKDSDDGAALEGETASTPAYAVAEPRRIRPRSFSVDVRRMQRLAQDPDLAALRADASGSGSTDDGSFACTPADWGSGTFVPVTYGGDPGVLVFRRVDGDTQVVDLFQCGSADVLRSITLPAP